jgi:hypothetical protein
MQIRSSRGVGSIFEQTLAKLAARQVVAEFETKGKTWEEIKPQVQETLQKAASVGQVEEADVVGLLQKVAASGVKIGDGSQDALQKEAFQFSDIWNKPMQWLGKGVGNAGQAAGQAGQGIGNAANWMKDKAQQAGQAIKNMPQTMQNAGQSMQFNAAKRSADGAVSELEKAVQNLTQFTKSNPAAMKAMPIINQALTMLKAQLGQIVLPQQNAQQQQAPGIVSQPGAAPAAAGAPAAAPAAAPGAPAGV